LDSGYPESSDGQVWLGGNVVGVIASHHLDEGTSPRNAIPVLVPRFAPGRQEGTRARLMFSLNPWLPPQL